MHYYEVTLMIFKNGENHSTEIHYATGDKPDSSAAVHSVKELLKAQYHKSDSTSSYSFVLAPNGVVSVTEGYYKSKLNPEK